MSSIPGEVAEGAPGPRGMGVLRAFRAMGRTDPLSFWREMHAQYGDVISLKLGPLNIWFFASPEAIYEIFVTQNRVMRKGIGYSGLRKLLGNGLITNDRENWGEQRQRLNPVFSPGAINTYAGSVHDACEAGMAELRELAASAKPADLGHAMTRLTMRIISLAAFGIDLTRGHDEIVDAFEYAFAFVADITADPVRPPLFVPTAENRKFKHALSVIDGFLDELIDQSKSQSKAGGMSGSIFSALEGVDRNLLRDEIITLYFAGFETTARTMTFLMHLLPQYPETLNALRKEAATLVRPGVADSVPKMLPVATEVVNEALRLYPPVAMMARQSNADCTIDGYRVKANSLIIVCPFLAQRNEIWWPQADAFAPSPQQPLSERLLHRGAFAPFGAGARMCLGKHFAMVEMALATAMIVRDFTWQLKDASPLVLDFHGTLRPARPVFGRLSLI